MDIKSFINDSRLKGMSDNAIKSALLNMGAPPAEVNAAIPYVPTQPQPEPREITLQEVHPQAAVPQDVHPQIVTPQQVQPSTAPAQQIQPHITAPQEKQPKALAPLIKAGSQITHAEPAQAVHPPQTEIELARIIKEAQAKMGVTSVSAKPQTVEPQGNKETVMQTIGTLGTEPAAPSGGAPATTVVFGNQQPATAVAQSEPVQKSKKPLIMIIAAILILGGAGAGYFFLIKNKTTAPQAENTVATSTQVDALIAVQGVIKNLGEVKTTQDLFSLMTAESAKQLGPPVGALNNNFTGAEYVSGTIGADGNTAEVVVQKSGATSTLYFALENGSWKFDVLRSREESEYALFKIADARRVADLRETQANLELYYNKNGSYPKGAATWPGLQTTLTGAGIGVTVIPDDPSAPAKHYMYASDDNGVSYVLGATLDSSATSTDSLFKNSSQFPKGYTGTAGFTSCNSPVYCVLGP